MDLRIGLDPLAGVVVGNLVVVAGGEGRHHIDADDAVVGVVVGVDDDAEIDVDRAALLAYGLLAVLLDQRLVEIVEDDGRRLVAIVPLGLLQHEEDVDVLQRLGLGVRA